MQKANGLNLKMCAASYKFNDVGDGLGIFIAVIQKPSTTMRSHLPTLTKKDKEKDHGSYSSKDHQVLDNHA